VGGVRVHIMREGKKREKSKLHTQVKLVRETSAKQRLTEQKRTASEVLAASTIEGEEKKTGQAAR